MNFCGVCLSGVLNGSGLWYSLLLEYIEFSQVDFFFKCYRKIGSWLVHIATNAESSLFFLLVFICFKLVFNLLPSISGSPRDNNESEKIRLHLLHIPVI